MDKLPCLVFEALVVQITCGSIGDLRLRSIPPREAAAAKGLGVLSISVTVITFP